MYRQTYILDVAKIINAEIGSSLKYRINKQIKNIDEIKIKNNISGEVIFNRVKTDKLLGLFQINTILELTCVRCLKKFKKPVNLFYEQEFSMHPQEDEFPILPNKTVDIFDSIRQELILSIPTKPLCRINCKGIIRK